MEKSLFVTICAACVAGAFRPELLSHHSEPKMYNVRPNRVALPIPEGGVASAALYRDASPTALGAIMSAAALTGAALYAFWLRKRVEG